MKTITLFLFLFSAGMQLGAQEENLQRHLTRDSTGRSLSIIGLETSTTSYIDTIAKDSSQVAPYLSVSFNYHHKSNFGVSTKTYFLTKAKNSGFYLTTLSAYYANYNTRLSPVISYSRLIQHDRASIPYSPIRHEIFAQLRYTASAIEPAAGVDIGFGKDKEASDQAVTDVNAFASVAHWFVWQRTSNRAFAFVPTLQLNAGTDRYFRYLESTRYISQNRSLTTLTRGRSGRGRRGSESGTTPPAAYVVHEANEFTLSNLECNAYVLYTAGRFSLAPSGSLYFPFRGDDKTVYGYWQLNLSLRIP